MKPVKDFLELLIELETVLRRYDILFQKYRRTFLSGKKNEDLTKYNEELAIEEMRNLTNEAQEIANEIADRLLQGNLYKTELEKESINLQITNIYWQFRNVKHANATFGDKLPKNLKDSFNWLEDMIATMEFNIREYNKKVTDESEIRFYGFKIISPEEAKKLVQQESFKYL